MSAESQPISPARFAEALHDLPASSLALKVLELRNSIAHLDYSNAELKPYADGTASAVGEEQGQAQGTPDQDCVDAIRENEAVIERMQQRIEMIRAEVEGRGFSWREFQGKEDDAPASAPAETSNATSAADAATAATTNATTNGNGVNGDAPAEAEPATGQQHEAWRDGTFQTGTIRGMSDEELLRQLMGRMPGEDREDDDPEAGMHL